MIEVTHPDRWRVYAALDLALVLRDGSSMFCAAPTGYQREEIERICSLLLEALHGDTKRRTMDFTGHEILEGH